MKIPNSLKPCLIAALFLACGASRADEPPRAVSDLEGRWTGTMSEAPGATFTFEFGGDRLDVRGPPVDGRNIWLRGRITLNIETEPRQMDFRVEEASNPSNLHQTIPIIFEVRGDELRIASSGRGRPLRFVDDGIEVYRLKRERSSQSAAEGSG